MATATQPMLTGSSFGAAPITAVDAQMMAQRARMLLMPHDMIMPQPPPTIIESMQPPPPPPPIVEEPPPQEENESIAAEEPPPELPALSQPVEEPPRVVPPPPPASFLASLPTDAADAVVLAARLADAERQIAALQVELAIANERAESFRALAAAKDEIINAAQAQTKEWRKHAGEVLATSAKAAAASVSKSSSSSSEKGGSSSSKLKK